MISRYEVTDEFSHRVTASVGERPMAVLVHLCLGLVDGRLGTATGSPGDISHATGSD